MSDNASAAEEPAALAGRVRSALESGDLDAVRDLLDPGARWGAPDGPGDADCRNRDQVIAWWTSARAAGRFDEHMAGGLERVSERCAAGG
jgi:hypothetical protein